MLFFCCTARTTDTRTGNCLHWTAENHSHSQIFRYGRSIFCLPDLPEFSDFFDLCLHRVSVVRAAQHHNFFSGIGDFDVFLLKQSTPLLICTWFFLKSLIYELDFWTGFFLSISNWICAGYKGSKNQIWNRQKIKFKNQFCELEF